MAEGSTDDWRLDIIVLTSFSQRVVDSLQIHTFWANLFSVTVLKILRVRLIVHSNSYKTHRGISHTLLSYMAVNNPIKSGRYIDRSIVRFNV